MACIDGFVPAVPTANRETFRAHAAAAAEAFKAHGALRVFECRGDDAPEGRVTSFPMAVKREEGETVVFSWIMWPSREARDAGMRKVMQDPGMSPENQPDALRRPAGDPWRVRDAGGSVRAAQEVIE